MKVELLTYTANPEILCGNIANTSYGGDCDLGAEKALRVLAKCLSSGHMSVIEHMSFTFQISGISRVTSHQLVRNRIASYCQQSQRYTLAEDAKITPQTIRANTEATRTYNTALRKLEEAYHDLISLGIPKEDARYLLPNATPTKLIMTMNARELLLFLSQRCCIHAQWEIRAMAEKIYNLCYSIAPLTFSYLTPNCAKCTTCEVLQCKSRVKK